MYIRSIYIKKEKQQKHSTKNAMHYVAIHLIITGSVVYGGSILAGAVELVVKLCTHSASFEGEKLVETLAKQAQGPLLCSQIRLKTTCLCSKLKKGKQLTVSGRGEAIPFEKYRCTLSPCIFKYELPHKHVGFSAHAHSFSAAISLYFWSWHSWQAGSFEVGSVWKGSRYKAEPWERGSVWRWRTTLAQGLISSPVHYTLCPLLTAVTRLCIWGLRKTERPELWSWVAAVDWTRRWEDFSFIAVCVSYTYINIHWVKGCVVLLRVYVHVLLCMRVLLKEPE